MYNTPLAYFITFTCYGTWLHGDERGSVDDEHNRYGQEFIVPNQQIKTIRRDQMRDEPLIFNQEERTLVEDTFAKYVTIVNGGYMKSVSEQTMFMLWSRETILRIKS